eukprot:TRINITY_DN3653_c0_g1_i2.p1 TRINITY_DN3653_c0_g1~~TRINITY_DN3653_c0_g1_i2.p1  ORF type:complete len:523 (-),score=112.59 TRINITY_DN3653_c0_g1_i2:22-1458(-)
MDDLSFGGSAESTYRTLRTISKDTDKNLFYRLRSIIGDSEAIEEKLSVYPSEWKILANLRCGLWYRSAFDGTCYFKSTDGHVGQWQFSLSRTNLHIVKDVAKSSGCVIIDSTRKGKRFPDSMSRTIPIWACTINRALAKIRGLTWDTSLHMPHWVPASEKSQVEPLIDTFVEKLLSSGAQLHEFGSSLEKPLRVMWVQAHDVTWLDDEDQYSNLPFTPVICLSASSTQMRDQLYIQGAGDDEESWAQGLSPKLFWDHQSMLMDPGYPGIEDRVSDLLRKEKEKIQNCAPKMQNEIFQIFPVSETGISIATDPSGLDHAFDRHDVVVNCSSVAYHSLEDKPGYKHIVANDKGRSTVLPMLDEFMKFVSPHVTQHHNILIHSVNGNNIPICLVLSILLTHYDFQGNLMEKPRTQFSKEIIQRMFLYLEQHIPQCRPSGFLMRDINKYFMTPKCFIKKPTSRSNTPQDANMEKLANDLIKI